MYVHSRLGTKNETMGLLLSQKESSLGRSFLGGLQLEKHKGGLNGASPTFSAAVGWAVMLDITLHA